MRIIARERLNAEKGIHYCSDHLRRMEQQGRFPKSFPIGGRRAYKETEIDAWLEARIAERDGQAA